MDAKTAFLHGNLDETIYMEQPEGFIKKSHSSRKACVNRIMLPFVVNFDAELEHMDVKTTFLHGNIDETIYTEQPEGFIKKGD